LKKSMKSLIRFLRSASEVKLPPFAAERLEELDAQRLIYHLPKPGPDGRTQLILSPLELIERIAALVPPPRQHATAITVYSPRMRPCAPPSRPWHPRP
jgi:hypothetical protein